MENAKEAAMTSRISSLQATVFGRLNPAQLEEVARLSDERHFNAGEDLCHQGECSQESFVIADGYVSVRVEDAVVAKYGPGDVVGDWALFGDGRRTATVRALTDVDAVVVDSREMDLLLMAVPAAARILGPHA